jgi:hypothetical protein
MSPAFAIPSSYFFAGTWYNDLYISSDGFIMFGSTGGGSGCCSAPTLPTTSWGPLISDYWCDSYSTNQIYFGPGSGAYANPFVIRFDGVSSCCSNGVNPFVFDIVLYQNGDALISILQGSQQAHMIGVQFTSTSAVTMQALATTFVGAYRITPPQPPRPRPTLASRRPSRPSSPSQGRLP